MARFVRLWEVRAGAGQLTAEEAEAFTWWFASDKVDPSWSLPVLVAVVPLMDGRRFLHPVLQRLAVVAPDYPELSLRALRSISAIDTRNEIVYHRDEAKAALEAAVSSEDEAVRRDALDLADRLGRRGLTELKGLLDAYGVEAG